MNANIYITWRRFSIAYAKDLGLCSHLIYKWGLNDFTYFTTFQGKWEEETACQPTTHPITNTSWQFLTDQKHWYFFTWNWWKTRRIHNTHQCKNLSSKSESNNEKNLQSIREFSGGPSTLVKNRPIVGLTGKKCWAHWSPVHTTPRTHWLPVADIGGWKIDQSGIF